MSAPPPPLAPSPDPVVRPTRTWTHPDTGHRYRLVLEPLARHRVRRGDGRPVLTFVPLSDPRARQEVRIVAEGWSLESAGDGELDRRLAEDQGAPVTGHGRWR